MRDTFWAFLRYRYSKSSFPQILNLCRNPGLAEEIEGIDNKLSLKVTRLTHEINQTLNQRQVEPGKALSLILECAAEKYRVCQMGRLDHRTGNIQDQLKGIRRIEKWIVSFSVKSLKR